MNAEAAPRAPYYSVDLELACTRETLARARDVLANYDAGRPLVPDAASAVDPYWQTGYLAGLSKSLAERLENLAAAIKQRDGVTA